MNIPIKRQLNVIVASLAFPFFVQAASFDCAKASSLVEKLICSDASVSQLDEQLNLMYIAGIEKAEDEEAFKQAQHAWLKEKRSPCKDVACLVKVYTTRIDQLTPQSLNQDGVAIEVPTPPEPVSVASSSAGYYLPNSENIEGYKRPLTFVHTYGNSYPICKPYMDMLNETKYMDFPACGRKILPEYSQFILLDWIEVTDETEKVKAVKDGITLHYGWTVKTDKELNRLVKSYMDLRKENRMAVFKTSFDFNKDQNPEVIYKRRIKSQVTNISHSNYCGAGNFHYVSDNSINPDDVINLDGTINSDPSWEYGDKGYNRLGFGGLGQLFMYKNRLYVDNWFSSWGPQTNALEIWTTGQHIEKICGFKIIGQ